MRWSDAGALDIGGWLVRPELGLGRRCTPAQKSEHHPNLERLLQPGLDQFHNVLRASSTTELTAYDIVDLILAPVYLAALFTPPATSDHTVDIER